MSGNLFLQELLRETGQKASKTKMKAIEDLHRKHFARKIAGIQPLPGAEDLARISNLNSPYEPYLGRGNLLASEGHECGLSPPHAVAGSCGDSFLHDECSGPLGVELSDRVA